MRTGKKKLNSGEKEILKLLWKLEEVGLKEVIHRGEELGYSEHSTQSILQSLEEKGQILKKCEREETYFIPVQDLTRAEEEIMQVLWHLKKAYVHDLIRELERAGKKLHYNTVSTIVRILEEKGFVAYRAHGKSHEYYPLVEKSQYSNFYLKNFMHKYFGGSFSQMVSFFVNQNDVNLQDMEALRQSLDKDSNEG